MHAAVVTSFGSRSVTELNASDGSWVRTLSDGRWPRTLLHGCVFGILSGGSYRLSNPSVIAAVGSHVWIPDGRTSVTVVTDGSLVMNTTPARGRT